MKEAKRRKPRGRMVALVTILTISLFLQTVTFSEGVPDHAKFMYDAEMKIFIPCPEEGEPAFFPVEGKFDEASTVAESEWDGVITWGQLKSQKEQFAEFALPEGKGWDGFALSGNPIPIWRTVVLIPESRWDNEGHWRY